MNIRIITYVLTLLVTTLPSPGQGNAVKALLSDSTLSGASFSFCMADVNTGEIIYEYDSGRNLAPASVMKLYPTSVALSLLGPDYRFETTVGLRGTFNSRKGVLDGDIVICGGGDPALGSAYFAGHYGDVVARWAAALADSVGLRRVTGRVAAATSIYDYQPVPGGWGWDDIGNYYGAGAYDINYKDNIYKIFIKGFDEGQPALIDSVEPTGKDIILTNNLLSSGSSDEGYVFNSPYSDRAWLEGTVPVNRQTALKASLTDPPMTLVRLLHDELVKAGVEIREEPTAYRTEINSDDIFRAAITTPSPQLGEIIRVTNHESVNLYAEQLCKHLGYELTGKGSFASGLNVMKNFLDSIGCEPERAMLLDASGLSANNNISSLMTVKLLRYMYLGKDHDVFVASLPEGGVSGTMKYYFRDEMFKGRVRAKTGSISGVRSFAGYVTTQSGRVVAFAMLSNGFTAPWRRVTDNMEKIIGELIINY